MPTVSAARARFNDWMLLRRTNTCRDTRWRETFVSAEGCGTEVRVPGHAVANMTLPGVSKLSETLFMRCDPFSLKHSRRTWRQGVLLLTVAIIGGGLLHGCRQDEPLAPQPIPMPDQPEAPRIEGDERRPLPQDAGFHSVVFPSAPKGALLSEYQSAFQRALEGYDDLRPVTRLPQQTAPPALPAPPARSPNGSTPGS